MRGGGGVIGLVMGATGTTERERLLGRGTRTMVCDFIPASDGRISSSASRRVASYLYTCFALTYKHNLQPRGC